jgi:hypothetical protein
VKIVCVIVLISLSLALAGCWGKGSQNSPNKSNEKKSKSVHGEPSSSGEVVRFIDVLKTKSLPPYPGVTIGAAFDGYPYFTRHEWSETRANNGKIYIDCNGWFDPKGLDDAALKRGVAARGLAVKFVITADGTFGVVMVSRLESKGDGTVSSEPEGDLKGILDRIFGKKEIRF